MRLDWLVLGPAGWFHRACILDVAIESLPLSLSSAADELTKWATHTAAAYILRTLVDLLAHQFADLSY